MGKWRVAPGKKGREKGNIGRTSENVPSDVVRRVERDGHLGLLLDPVAELHLLSVVSREEGQSPGVECDGEVSL